MKNAVLNTFFAAIFIMGFYLGGLAQPQSLLSGLSANAAMAPDRKEDKEAGAILANTLALEFEESAPAEEAPSVPQQEADHTEEAPVLESGAGEGVTLKNDTAYDPDTGSLLSEPLVKHADKISVLIIHTHTSEAYTPDAEYPYEMSDPYRTCDEERNVVAVGNELERALKERGVEVVHDKTSHDYPSYTGSYRRALETVGRELAAHPGISLVLDIHRDAITDENGEYMKTRCVINGEECAQAMLVVGTDFGGLEHPAWRENLKYALRIHKAVSEKYPSLVRGIHLRAERFNGHAREGAMIIEIGSNGNTLGEALKCAGYLGECIADMINTS